MSAIRERSTEIVVHGLALIAVALLWLRRIADGSLREFYFISDHLYVPSLIRDVVQQSGKLSDWHLTPSPYVWPDMFVYLALRPFSASLEPVLYASGFVQFLLIALSAWLLVRSALPRFAVARIAVALTLVAWVAIHNDRWVPVLAPLFVISCHGGAVFASLLTLAFCLRVCKSERHVWVAMAAMSLMAAASDPLYVASCSLPLFALAGWSRWAGKQLTKRSSVSLERRCLWSGAWSLVGLGLVRVCNARSTRGYVQPRPWRMESAFTQLLNDALDISSFEYALLAAMFLLSLIAYLRPVQSERGTAMQSLAVWQTMSVLCTVAASLLTGRYQGDGALRYFLVPITCGAVFTGMFVAVRIADCGFHVSRIYLTAAVSILSLSVLALLLVSLQPLAHGQYASNLRARGECVSAIAMRESVDTVLAEYWNAKPLMLFMPERRLTAVQMMPDLGAPRWWINSRGWYRGQHRFGLVVTNNLDQSAIRERFGAPSRIEHCGELELYVLRGAARAQLSQSMERCFREFLADAR